MNLDNKYEIIDANKNIASKTLKEILEQNEKTILFFYPRDNTPGCTVENIDFTNLKSDFEAKGIGLIGVSKDSITSHEKFIEKQCLKNDLISDPDLVLHKELGAYGEKNNYGKIVQGVIRSSFVVDKNGEILNEYRNIRAKGHAERLLKELS